MSSLALQKMSNFYGSFFYINICGFISRDKYLQETRVLDNTYIRFKVQLPTSDSTEITAGGPKTTLEGPAPRCLLADTIHPKQVLVIEFLISTF